MNPGSSPARSDRAAAFSLVEVLLAIALLGMLALVCSQVLMGSLRIQTLQEEEQADLRRQREGLVLQFGGEPDAPEVVTVPEP